jgi:lysophospholipase L1-like esterase
MLRKLALALVSALVAVGMAEILVRAGGFGVRGLMQAQRKYGLLLEEDEGGYLRHPAGGRAVLQGVTVRFNSLGMRDDEPLVPKPPGRFRLLCVGDSVTFGPAVPQDATFTARLRTMLAPDGIEVVAAAVGGWNTVAEERFLTRHVTHLQPDLVLLLYVINDNELGEAFAAEKKPSTGLSTKVYRSLVLHSELFEWAAFVYQSRLAPPDWAALQRLSAWQQRQREATGGAPFSPRDAGWLESRAALQRSLDLLRAHDAGLVIFLQNQLNGRVEREALARLLEFGAEKRVPVFDTWPFFAPYPPVSLMNDGMRDLHPNAKGHEVLAEGVARTLRANGLLPAPRPSQAAG